MRPEINDTIAAIATSPGEAGIGIIRMSGNDALRIADEIFRPKDGLLPSQALTYTLHYGWVVCPENNKSIVDEVLLSVMRAPKSYTREDVVEINCHGGIVALRDVLDLVLKSGCRLAEPGEFTKRAFLNGRIDLSQAEAVLDIIRAKTDAALRIGVEQLRGTLSKELSRMRDSIVKLVALLEAHIDFPDEEVGLLDFASMRLAVAAISQGFERLLAGAAVGRIMREGVGVVICGKPNVGKSSLLNALLKQERSIVTPVAGTTRDTIEEIIDIHNIPLRIMDTAGILEPRDLVEKKAVRRSKRSIDQADLVLVLFDASCPLSREDEYIIRKLKKKHAIAVINKIDLKPRLNEEKIRAAFRDVVRLSAKRSTNIDALEAMIAAAVYQDHVNKDSVLVSNTRHIEKIKKAQKLIAESLDSLDNKVSAEFICQSLKDALLSVDDILGRRCSEDILDRIFSEFCIGK